MWGPLWFFWIYFDYVEKSTVAVKCSLFLLDCFNIIPPKREYFPVVILSKWLKFSFCLWSWKLFQNFSWFVTIFFHLFHIRLLFRLQGWMDLLAARMICLFWFINILGCNVCFFKKKLETDRYMSWPILLADIGLSWIYWYRHRCCDMHWRENFSSRI